VGYDKRRDKYGMRKGNTLKVDVVGEKRVTENGFLKNIYCFHFSKLDKTKFLRRKILSL
jgi:hypothetical protein